MTFDGSALCVYEDGVQAQCKALAGASIPATSIDWAIGAPRGCSPPCANTFVGVLDEVAVYTHALSPARIAAHYHLGSGT